MDECVAGLIANSEMFKHQLTRRRLVATTGLALPMVMQACAPAAPSASPTTAAKSNATTAPSGVTLPSYVAFKGQTQPDLRMAHSMALDHCGSLAFPEHVHHLVGDLQSPHGLRRLDGRAELHHRLVYSRLHADILHAVAVPGTFSVTQLVSARRRMR